MKEETLKDFIQNNPQAIVDLREAAKLIPQRKYGRLARALAKYAAEIEGDENVEKISSEPIMSIDAVFEKNWNQIQARQHKGDGLAGIPSGYNGLDSVTYGFQPGELIVVASRPSDGKSAFVATMARNIAVDYHIPVGFFTLEMSDERLITRIMVSETGLPVEKVRGAGKDKLTKEDYDKIQDGVLTLRDAPLYLDDTTALPVYEFSAKARKLVHDRNVKIIIVDGMQLMEGPVRFREAREQEVSAICRVLKETAAELQIPIVVTSQINRNIDVRGGNGRPQLSDLRESGAIEQIADIVLFVHRPVFVGVTDEGGFPGETDLIVAKYRDGEPVDVKMIFQASKVKFVDYIDKYYYTDSEHWTSSRMNDMGVEPAALF